MAGWLALAAQWCGGYVAWQSHGAGRDHWG